jgi:DNA modification methylase
LDPFLGSGTVILAAEQTGRKGFGVDVDPHYVDVALKRLKDRLSLEAVHLQTGMSFVELEAERAKSFEVAHG